ncbi:MAG: penicillin-binding transpeptidase domain-containing protein [Candidatus Curtissbacteria bacterium]|nr:penicillin-binding transpeptidase domain-containing protein [Candidatus Curtissbacteria bacterium]
MKKKKLHLLGADSAIFSERVGRLRFGARGDEEESGNRHKIFAFLIFAIVLIFLLRLFYLQVVTGAKNRTLAENNRIRLIGIVAPRGKILDRNGQVIGQSNVTYWLKKGDEKKEITLAQKNDLEAQGLASEDFSGSLGQIYEEVGRSYPLGEDASHVLGYTSLAQKADLNKSQQLTSQDLVGRAGIEETYEDFLKGTDGQKLIEVDATGGRVSIISKVASKQGENIRLTIDAKLQKVAYEALKKGAEKVSSNRGAIIVSNPGTGEVLALASLPSFDPNNVGGATNDPNKPLFNRALLGNYPPGSIFKIVTALAGLESGKINRDTEIEDVGEFEFSGVRFSNWYYTAYGGKDGVVKLDRAIARSNDIYFYRVGQTIGLDPIRQMALALGFGAKTGIDMPSEDFGLVPDGVWKQSTQSQPWYPGDTMHMAIGQGFMLVTPMQISNLINFMASGKLIKPYLVSQIDGPKTSKINPKVIGKNLVSDANFNLVREGMRQVCATGGTGWPFFMVKNYTLGCKTGTAEKTEGNPHAWFGAFAPFDNPQISVTVLVEDGGEGSTVAGPVAKEVLDWWFGQK